jgi:hypothetical protein
MITYQLFIINQSQNRHREKVPYRERFIATQLLPKS